MSNWWDEPSEPSEPEIVRAPVVAGPPPRLSCAEAVLAALPPDEPVANARDVFVSARIALERVFTSAMTGSDIEAFLAILRRYPDHEIARRFRRFTKQRQQHLEGMLADGKVRAKARALERAQRAIANRPAR